ncbi:hypothetical protein [Cellulomonas sp. Y8]|uniref:hypothetical protein n=1 Tax=Cellulomonas sp. Y8 TaxID=2591145 RepID=UPI0011C77CD0|nr:hypothetical protein [Cellulomonas sp. Y8]
MTHALTWRSPIHIPHATIRIADVHAPLTKQETWRAALNGHLYLLAGTSTHPDRTDRIAGYVGISEHHTSGRAWASLTRWVRSISALDIKTIALVTLDSPHPDPDVLRVIECSVIRMLNPEIDLLNTVSAATTATQALGDRGAHWARYGHDLGTHLQQHAFSGRANRQPSPAHSLRETAIRVVLASQRALTADEIIHGVRALGGLTYSGTSPQATVRRDLTIRETHGHPGPPRVLTTRHAGRCLFFPASLTATTAVQNYLDHHADPTAA